MGKASTQGHLPAQHFTTTYISKLWSKIGEHPGKIPSPFLQSPLSHLLALLVILPKQRAGCATGFQWAGHPNLEAERMPQNYRTINVLILLHSSACLHELFTTGGPTVPYAWCQVLAASHRTCCLWPITTVCTSLDFIVQNFLLVRAIFLTQAKAPRFGISHSVGELGCSTQLNPAPVITTHRLALLNCLKHSETAQGLSRYKQNTQEG